MRKSKFSEHQIIAILKAVEAGRAVKDVCREHEISDATYYQWKKGSSASGCSRFLAQRCFPVWSTITTCRRQSP
jgi:transposase-like protein